MQTRSVYRRMGIALGLCLYGVYTMLGLVVRPTLMLHATIASACHSNGLFSLAIAVPGPTVSKSKLA